MTDDARRSARIARGRAEQLRLAILGEAALLDTAARPPVLAGSRR